jgi:hypothetical protein
MMIREEGQERVGCLRIVKLIEAIRLLRTLPPILYVEMSTGAELPLQYTFVVLTSSLPDVNVELLIDLSFVNADLELSSTVKWCLDN